MVRVGDAFAFALCAPLLVSLQGCGGGGGDDGPDVDPHTNEQTSLKPNPDGASSVETTTTMGTMSTTTSRTTATTTATTTTTTTPDPEPCVAYGERPIPIPDRATALNGVTWPPACYKGKDKYHVFVIGDWGGMCGYGTKNDCTMSAEDSQASWDKTEHPFRPYPMSNHRGAKKGIDDAAQHHVRDRMNEVAEMYDPEFVLNVGDNFYPGGIVEHCAGSPAEIDFNKMPHQFKTTYEEMYNGKGLQKKEWLSVLGNHDYGGVCFNMGWTQQIWYTWNQASSQRWIMPAQYYFRQARFGIGADTITADMWFLDTNVEDTSMDENHDICSKPGNTYMKNAGSKSGGWYCKGFLGEWKSKHEGYGVCENTNLTSPYDCGQHFKALWAEQIKWLAHGLKHSHADWQIIVTHFPAHYPKIKDALKGLSAKYGVDLIVTGHTHGQELYYKRDIYGEDFGDTAVIVSGGGGGIFSEGTPNRDGHDNQYGFMDLTISKTEIGIKSYSWNTKPDHIEVSFLGRQDCSGKYGKQQWERNDRPQYSSSNGQCKIYWENHVGWVLNANGESAKWMCKGGIDYSIPGGSWEENQGEGVQSCRVAVTKGKPMVRLRETVSQAHRKVDEKLFV